MTNDHNRAKLLELMGAGIPPSAAAAAVGVDPSYVSQLLDTDEFRAALVEASAGRIQAALEHDNTVEGLEKKLLRVIEQKLPFVRNPMEAAKIFQILNNSKKRLVTGSDSSNANQGVQMVTIVLPKAAAVNIKVNTANQVIDVAGRTMAPLPSRELPKLQEADAARAVTVLENAEKVTTIGGVVRVL